MLGSTATKDSIRLVRHAAPQVSGTAGGTKLLMLHFQNVGLPGTSPLEVDLGYDTDVFTSTDGRTFWTWPINVHAFASGLVPGSVQ